MKKKKKSNRLFKKDSKAAIGYAASLINLKEKCTVVPSTVNMKKIKSTLAPLFKRNNRGKSFTVYDINKIKTR